jgi:hypothetical protein
MTKSFKLTLLAGAVAGCFAAAGSARAYDRHIELINETHLSVTSFFASNVGTDSWEDDVLGNGALPSGYQVRVNLDDGSQYCHFDFKTTFSNGTSIVRRNVDVCGFASYTRTN